MEQDRRYDIDWLRVIAIALLLIYHIAITFEPWAVYIGFIQSDETSSVLWIPMALINYWRIPLLFFISGMGVCFAMRRRNWKELLIERGRRILVPLLFGTFFIVPVHVVLFQLYYNHELTYSPNMGHLWFLGNICIYVLQIIGFAFLEHYDYKFFNFFRNMLKKPYSVYLFIIPFILEAELTNPEYFSSYVGNGHGFVLGMFAFFFGFLFIAIGDTFWNALNKVKSTSLLIALGLYLVRLFFFEFNPPHYLSAAEAVNWIFAIFGYGHAYLNKPSKILRDLNQAAYPVYIIHMMFFFAGTYLILPLGMPLFVNFILIVVFTFAGSYLTYELIIKRIKYIRPLFGLKNN